MRPKDRTEELLREYFAREIDQRRRGKAMGTDSRLRTTATRLWLGRAAVAAAILLFLGLPLVFGHSISPSTRVFASVHQQIGTAASVARGLVAARDFMHLHFAGGKR